MIGIKKPPTFHRLGFQCTTQQDVITKSRYCSYVKFQIIAPKKLLHQGFNTHQYSNTTTIHKRLRHAERNLTNILHIGALILPTIKHYICTQTKYNLKSKKMKGVGRNTSSLSRLQKSAATQVCTEKRRRRATERSAVVVHENLCDNLR